MKTLLIMRHAKSAYPPAAADDFARPLSRRGEEDAPRMAQALAAYGPRPDAVLASAAVRAAATARAVAGAAGVAENEVRLDQRLYLAAVETLHTVAAEVPDSVAALLVVGHNPGMEQWLERLTGACARLPTAALAAVELPMSRWVDVGLVRGQLQWLLVPRLVRRLN